VRFLSLSLAHGTAQLTRRDREEAWAQHHVTVRKHLRLPDHEMLFAGMAVGFEDVGAPINRMRADRAELREFLTVHGAATSRL